MRNIVSSTPVIIGGALIIPAGLLARLRGEAKPAFSVDPAARAAIERRLGEGAKVELKDIDAEGLIDIDDLLQAYAKELRATDQDDEADRILDMAADATSNFMMIIPQKVQADPSISTE